MLSLSKSDRKLITKARGFQSEIARECGVTRQTVSLILNGRGTSENIERAIVRKIDLLKNGAAKVA